MFWIHTQAHKLSFPHITYIYLKWEQDVETYKNLAFWNIIFTSASHYQAIEYYIIKFPKTTLGQSVLYPGGMRGDWHRHMGKKIRGNKIRWEKYAAI